MNPVKSHEPRAGGDYSMHTAYDPEKCPKTSSNPEVKKLSCGEARVVDCCEQEKERDIEECSRCGLQRSVPCSFDDDFA